MTEGFEEFLRERREHTERTRRLLIGVLGVTCVALAVSNVVLALRLTAVRARPAAEAPAPSASVPSRAEEPPSRVTLPPAGLPSATSPPDEPPRPATPLPIVREGPSPVIEPTLAPAAPEDVTAAWMLTTYGR